MYHQIKQKEMNETLTLMAELAEKFPMLSVNQINFYEFAKFYQKNPKDFITMVVFLDCMKQMNHQTTNGITYFINLEDVRKINVKKNQDKWAFDVYNSAKEKVTLRHVYTHVFN